MIILHKIKIFIIIIQQGSNHFPKDARDYVLQCLATVAWITPAFKASSPRIVPVIHVPTIRGPPKNPNSVHGTFISCATHFRSMKPSPTSESSDPKQRFRTALCETISNLQSRNTKALRSGTVAINRPLQC
jgi:hypothetical protein